MAAKASWHWNYVTVTLIFSASLCWASTRHHATRICCWAPARLQLPIDIWRKRSRSAANQPHAAAAIDRRDRQTDTWPLYGPCSAYHASIVINGNNVRSYKYRITSSHLPSNTSPCNQLCLHHWIRTKVNFFYKRLRIGHTPVTVTHSSFIDLTGSPTCSNRHRLLSVKHILTECTTYNQLRNQHHSAPT